VITLSLYRCLLAYEFLVLRLCTGERKSKWGKIVAAPSVEPKHRKKSVMNGKRGFKILENCFKVQLSWYTLLMCFFLGVVVEEEPQNLASTDTKWNGIIGGHGWHCGLSGLALWLQCRCSSLWQQGWWFSQLTVYPLQRLHVDFTGANLVNKFQSRVASPRWNITNQNIFHLSYDM